MRRTVGDELVVSLSTKEPAVAKQRAIEALTQFDAVWATFANPPTKLTFKEVVALAGEAFRAFRAMEDDPESPEVWRNIIEANLAALKGELPLPFIGSPEQKRRTALHGRFSVFVDGVLRTHKLRVDDATYGLLLEQLGRALTDAAELLLKRSEGDYSPDKRGEKYPAVVKKVPDETNGATLWRLRPSFLTRTTRRTKTPRPSASTGPS